MSKTKPCAFKTKRGGERERKREREREKDRPWTKKSKITTNNSKDFHKFMMID